MRAALSNRTKQTANRGGNYRIKAPHTLIVVVPLFFLHHRTVSLDPADVPGTDYSISIIQYGRRREIIMWPLQITV